MTAALEVKNLTVGFGGRPGQDPVVQDVSFEVAAGECLAIVGESGSGKSVTARSLLGLAGAHSWVQADAVSITGQSVLGLPESAWRRRRGRDVGLILQDALVSLDPLRPIGREIGDSLRLHTKLSAADRTRRVLELLDSVGLPDGASRIRQRSGQLSGGQRQRALIASAIALDPPLLIADEPTTALDVTVQAQVLELLAEIKRRGNAIVLISHDLAVVSRIADRVAVMSAGRIIETGPTAEVLQNPQHPLTRAMLAAVPVDKPRRTQLSAVPVATIAPRSTVPDGLSVDDYPVRPVVLEASELRRSFRRPDGSRLVAVDDVSFRLHRAETLGLVGESGSGKTTTARLALALETPDAGEVRIFGEPWSAVQEKARRRLRGSVGAIYQDALGSFDPRLTVGDILRHALRAPAGGTTERGGSGHLSTESSQLLDQVGLPSGVLSRRPVDLSGGQRQRVGIARALASRPRILICDEPVSALDVTVQAQVLDLLDELQQELSLSLLFISHDLGVIGHMSDRVAVMKDGRIVETGATADVFADPRHPYTQQLLEAVPRFPQRSR
ncbi:dipeptide ABC transporter ATP-binding protein [Glaciibacter superstes]|uniref:dipeptide ABC transporter ATP-binding protein n=1 Tax=Glaciibacter superstes TaxID=501023 RepID=UPI0003B4DCD1|nr:ABC transporter ATP-binding protein [Glaciibacter superstes]